MRTIKRSNAFKKDYKRQLKGNYQSVLEEGLVTVLKLLVAEALVDTPVVLLASPRQAGKTTLVQKPKQPQWYFCFKP